MHNSSSLTELLSRLFVYSRAQRRSALDTFFVNGSSKGGEAVARDDVGMPLAELISGSNHVLCCGSAIKPWCRTTIRCPVMGTRTSVGHGTSTRSTLCDAAPGPDSRGIEAFK